VIYFDTSYLVRLYYRDAGWELARSLAATDGIACSLHGKAETVAAFHRKWREGSLSGPGWRALLSEFKKECAAGAIHWPPVSPAVITRASAAYATLAPSAWLRAADAIHLACAAENGFKEIHSNDGQPRAAASHFGVAARNVI
jgi:predicted nucleic acid-binding protein